MLFSHALVRVWQDRMFHILHIHIVLGFRRMLMQFQAKHFDLYTMTTCACEQILSLFSCSPMLENVQNAEG